MKLGGRLEREESAEAHADPATQQIADLLASEQEPLLVEFLVTALKRGPDGLQRLARAFETRLHPTQFGVLADLRDKLQAWFDALGEDEIALRKGAVLERLVLGLLSFRLAPVQREFRVTFSDGQVSAPFDVLASPSHANWEAVECKWSLLTDGTQAADLKWAAKQSIAQEGGALIVALASMSTRQAVQANLRSYDLCGLVRFVSGETLLELRDGPAYAHCQTEAA